MIEYTSCMSSFICLSMYVPLLHICKCKRVYRHKLHRVLKYDVHCRLVAVHAGNVFLHFPLAAFFSGREFRAYVSFVYDALYHKQSCVQRQTFMPRVRKYA